MPSNYIGRERSTAVYQLIGLVYLVTVFPIVLTIGLIGGLVYMVLDVLMKLLMDRGIGGNTATSLGRRLFNWPLDQLRWIATGDGEFPWLP